jgi:hypothetical protein
MSSIIRDNIFQSSERFRQVTRDLSWLNVTLHGQNKLYTAIRQLKLALLQLTWEIDDLFDTVQCVIHGKLPVNFVTPTVLQNVLNNVTLRLPEGYELRTGTSLEDMHLYYE